MKHLFFIISFTCLVHFFGHSQTFTFSPNSSETIQNQENIHLHESFSATLQPLSDSTYDKPIYTRIQPSRELDKVSLGLGIGQDYGLLGLNLCVYPQRNIGLFAGVGYAIAGAGYNVGTKIRFVAKETKANVIPSALLMYGYNGVIAVQGASQYNKFFYGTTMGFSLDVYPNGARSGGGFWSFGLLIPFRSSEVQNYIDNLKKNHNIEFKNELWPVTFSIGYRFILD